MTILSDDPSTTPAVTQGSADSAISSRIVSVDPARGAENGTVRCATAEEVAVAVEEDRAGWRRHAAVHRAAGRAAAWITTTSTRHLPTWTTVAAREPRPVFSRPNWRLNQKSTRNVALLS